MIVVDSSVWVEYLRETSSAHDRALTHLIEDEADLAITEVVVMEVLAGARSERHRRRLEAELYRYPMLLLGGIEGYERAAELWRTCRAAGETVRKLTDCLVAVPAIAAGAPVLHLDRDFDVLARHTTLEVHPVP